MRRARIERILEIIPGLISWAIILSLTGFLIFRPGTAALLLIIYLIYWASRLFYMSTLLIMAHHRMVSKKNIDWLKLCEDIDTGECPGDFIHIVLYTIYKEPKDVLEESLAALAETNYPKDRLIVVLAGEERQDSSFDKLNELKTRFRGYFRDILVTIHPGDIKGEISCKGANATFAAKRVKEYLDERKYPLGNVLISCFDADTRPDKNYFSCLTYHFLKNPKRYQTSFQPLPIYSNNVYKVAAFARVIEIGSTFWQLIESMRQEKFVTFSSHSMSFKTLVEVGYWPVDLVSDDSLIYWKCFLRFISG